MEDLLNVFSDFSKLFSSKQERDALVHLLKDNNSNCDDSNKIITIV